jgi:adenylylsulfate kinase|tara:strand:+ start:28 stop:447 length:420 start_codon:yes stop_codon:yes gene_type:complete
MAKKILIMGLPDSGKTTLAKLLAPMFNAVLLNEDEVRKEANDWDFSEMGRSIQTNRMKRLADEAIQNNRNVIADFDCSIEHTREDLNADYIIWMDTIKESKLEPPKNFDFKVTHKDAQMFSFLIKQEILDKLKGLGPHD